MTRAVSNRAWLGLAAAALLVAGCRPPIKDYRGVPKKQTHVDKAERDKEGTLELLTRDGNRIHVRDQFGKPEMDADVETVQGLVMPGSGVQGAVTMEKANCLLYEKGKPSMRIQTPHGLWENHQLTTDSTAHGVTVDGKTIVDAQTAVWTSGTSLLELEKGQVQQMKDGKVDFTASGPKAVILNRIVTLTAGAKAVNAEGNTLTADRLRWNMDTGELTANGHVVVTQEGTRVTGEHLKANTKLERGHMTGNPKMILNRIPKPGDKTARAPKPQQAAKR